MDEPFSALDVLPRVSSNLLSGLIGKIAEPPFNGRADLPQIAAELHMEIDSVPRLDEIEQCGRRTDAARGHRVRAVRGSVRL
jgi:NitT/TauT family transport system ATP-binding protein